MAILTVGPTATYPTIAAAMAVAAVADTIDLQSGYGNETATVTQVGMTVTGDSTSTGILLNLGTGITSFTLAGTAPINVMDSPQGNAIVGNAGDNVITVTDAPFRERRPGRRPAGRRLSPRDRRHNGRLDVQLHRGRRHSFRYDHRRHLRELHRIDRLGRRHDHGRRRRQHRRCGFRCEYGHCRRWREQHYRRQRRRYHHGRERWNFIDGGDGANILTSGAGNDTIISGTGDDTIVAGAGNDVITIHGGADTVHAGAGSDLFIVDYAPSVTAVTMTAPSGSFGAGYSGTIADSSGNTAVFDGVRPSTSPADPGRFLYHRRWQRSADRRRRQRHPRRAGGQRSS